VARPATQNRGKKRDGAEHLQTAETSRLTVVVTVVLVSSTVVDAFVLMDVVDVLVMDVVVVVVVLVTHANCHASSRPRPPQMMSLARTKKGVPKTGALKLYTNNCVFFLIIIDRLVCSRGIDRQNVHKLAPRPPPQPGQSSFKPFTHQHPTDQRFRLIPAIPPSLPWSLSHFADFWKHGPRLSHHSCWRLGHHRKPVHVAKTHRNRYTYAT
jgi:hypothetical protein